MPPVKEQHSEGTMANPCPREITPSAAVEGESVPTRRLSPKVFLIKLLYNPLTWLAIGAHVLLLIVPFDPNVKTAEVIEAPEEDADESIAVDILNLAELASPTPPPESPSDPPPAVPPPAAPVAAPPPVPAAAPVAEDPAAEPEPLPDESDVPLDPPVPDPPSAPDPPPPAYDPTETQNAFVGNIAQLGIDTFTGTVQFPPDSFFSKGNGASFLDFSDPINPAPLAHSRDAVWMDEQLSDVIKTLNETYGEHVVLTPVGDYAGELLYELTDATGNSFMHVSLVEFRSGSTLVVMWPTNPNGGPA